MSKKDIERSDNHDNDKILTGYDTILKESALLTTFSTILFGFILNLAINPPQFFNAVDKIILLISLYSITVSACLFIMPVIYHHVQYPYDDIERFKKRSHRFTLVGLIPAGITLFLGLELALSSTLQSFLSFFLASIPFILVYILYRLRK